jgi:prephenate dehydratase
MAVTAKAITLWRQEVENKPGILAKALEPFAVGSTDLLLRRLESTWISWSRKWWAENTQLWLVLTIRRI